jgi:hypothetical protein
MKNYINIAIAILITVAVCAIVAWGMTPRW